MSAPKQVYRRSSHQLIAGFDLRDPEAAAALDRQREAWHGDASVEVLDKEHRVLIVRPGGARRLLRGRRGGEVD